MADKAQFFKVNYRTAFENGSVIVPALSHLDAENTIKNSMCNVLDTEFLGWQSVSITLENDTSYYFEANFQDYALYYNEETLGFQFLSYHFHQEIQGLKQLYRETTGNDPY
ncbi:hypothetical protein OVA10_04225 [Lelliottia sp. SL45]|uniref:hypothetical protein n=1 Tax=Lelliottia sp. SL45 TaxID=2994665 RepID=UPI00227256F7|nr:hypothetical protein [Lelliottia sp. SL45]MCY1697289.1 hypothetical protein [Lelliottia sp. SL45]